MQNYPLNQVKRHENPNNTGKRTQTTLNLMKQKPRLGAFYAIQLENGSELFYSSQCPQGELRDVRLEST